MTFTFEININKNICDEMWSIFYRIIVCWWHEIFMFFNLKHFYKFVWINYNFIYIKYVYVFHINLYNWIVTGGNDIGTQQVHINRYLLVCTLYSFLYFFMFLLSYKNTDYILSNLLSVSKSRNCEYHFMFSVQDVSEFFK